MVPVTRRTALRASGIALLSTLSGCSLLPSQSSMLDVAVFNHTDTPCTVVLDLFRESGDASSRGARSYDDSIHVEPQGEVRQENVVETHAYLVRYSVLRDNNRQTDEGHVHCYPADSSGEEYLVFDLHSPGVLTRR